MKLGLLQTKHNGMYDFLNPAFPYDKAQCLAMQAAQVEENLRLLPTAVGGGYDLLVTTECINYIRTGPRADAADAALYPPLDSAPVRRLGAAAAAAQSWLVAGFGYRQNQNAYNGALVFDRTGTLRQVCQKVHLAGDESVVFTPGEHFCVQDADFGRFGVCICWDLQFPETARTLALRGADLVVCPTWGWEADWYGRARAYENGIVVAAAMAVPAWGPITAPRTPSSVVLPDGQMPVTAPAHAAALLGVEVDLRTVPSARALRCGGRRPALYGALVDNAK